MSLAQQVAPHLPALRRFARALTGSQKSGDSYVAAVLETVIEDSGALRQASTIKVGLFHLFCRLWQTVDLNTVEENSAPWEAAADDRLGALNPRPREAFLLRSLEGFSLEQTAEILGIAASEAEDLIDEANREIAEQLTTSVLIIEDEPITALDIEDLVKSLGHTVTSTARTHKEAIDAIEADQPGLVLADIQLADGSSGIEAVKEILTKISPPVIFITAYPERLLTGERPEPTFLISKPYDPAAVRAMISQVLFFKARAPMVKAA
jgi:DNA-directed RNA polymerase specialized sigma24 family protein/CheY-like chemotaxis protein